MSIEVGTVNSLSRAALAAAVVGCCFWAIGAHGPPTAWGASSENAAAHVIAGYGLTILSFAAFPQRRRVDLIKAVILIGAILEIGGTLVGRTCDLSDLLSVAAGAMAVLLPSFVERFRSLCRADPFEPFTMVFPEDRRRRDPRLQTLSPAHQLSAAEQLTASNGER